MKLSFCIIVKNEATNLPQCLASVENLVDEIIVLDTGSSDRTVEIAKEFGAQVYHFKWCNDFSAARNASLKYATGDWILVLDADEILVPEIIPQLKTAINTDNYILINLLRQEIGANQSPYSLVSRLFRNHPEIYFSRPYHAMVDDSIVKLLQKQPNWQIISLPDVAILHYGYQPGIITAKDKFQKAKTTMQSYMVQNPNEPYVCSKLGALYIELGEVKRGIKLLQKGLKNQKNIDAGILYEIHYHLGIGYNKIQDIKQAKYHYIEAIKTNLLPQLQIGAYNNLGNLLLETGDLEAAYQAYTKTIQADNKFTFGYYNLGMVLKAKGLFTEAIAAYQQAINLNPNYAEAYQNLGVVLMKIGKIPESLAAFKQAINLHSAQNSPLAQQLRQGLKNMGFNDN